MDKSFLKKDISTKEKISNIWHYYKMHLIIIIAVLAVISYILIVVFTTVQPDINILYGHYGDLTTPNQIKAMEKELEKYAEDYNGDGKIVVRVNHADIKIPPASHELKYDEVFDDELDVTVSTKEKDEYLSYMFNQNPQDVKFISQLALGESFFLLVDNDIFYILNNKKGLEPINKVAGLKSDKNLFRYDLDKTVIGNSNVFKSLNEELFISVRQFYGTSFEKDKYGIQDFNNTKKFLNNIINNKIVNPN